MPTTRATRNVILVILATLITGMVLFAFAAGIGTTWLLMRGSTATSDEAAQFGVFWEAWHLVETNFFGDLPDAQHVTWGAIRGVLDTLDDPHTTFLEPQPRQREKEELSGQFGGIGATIYSDDDGNIALDPLPDLPAEKAGVQEGDVLVAVDDSPVTPEMTPSDVVTLIRGEVGTVVRLTLQRQGETEPLVIEIERQEIPNPSIEWRFLDQAEGMAYVRIKLFTGRTALELEDALEELEGLGMTHLILDLRSNPGGLFDAAIDVAGKFLRDGVIVYQIEKDGTEQAFQVRRGATFLDPPMVLLVDVNTASASEIVAGALQDHGRATLIGERTFGKGSVQEVFDLSDGSSVHITASKWLTPNRHQIDGQGLTPDLELTISEEDRSQGRDVYLERGIEYLLTGQ